ncbi:hypothetical protein D3C81_1617460 [compost metagenome]
MHWIYELHWLFKDQPCSSIYFYFLILIHYIILACGLNGGISGNVATPQRFSFGVKCDQPIACLRQIHSDQQLTFIDHP